MKATFEIEWDDDYGPWMSAENLLACLTEKCPNTTFKVRGVNDVGAPTFATNAEQGESLDAEVPS